MQQATSAQEPDDTLLATLLEAPAPRGRPLHPARLRSLGQQQAIALQGYRRLCGAGLAGSGPAGIRLLAH